MYVGCLVGLRAEDYNSQAFSESLLHRLRTPCPQEVVTLCLLYPCAGVFVYFLGPDTESEKNGR